MSKLDMTSKLYWKLFNIMRMLNKAKAANDALYDNYFGEECVKSSRIITDFEKAYDLHSIVIDYIEQSCKELDKILND
ncbi:hypothetical protein AAK894_09495 [Lachnospiraceae bacterium 46-61]